MNRPVRAAQAAAQLPAQPCQDLDRDGRLAFAQGSEIRLAQGIGYNVFVGEDRGRARALVETASSPNTVPGANVTRRMLRLSDLSTTLACPLVTMKSISLSAVDYRPV